jgi:hypothetical protein
MSDAMTQLSDLSERLQAGDVDALRATLADEYYGCAAAPGDPSAAERPTTTERSAPRSRCAARTGRTSGVDRQPARRSSGPHR